MANLVRARLPSQVRVALLCLIGVTIWAPAAPADSLPELEGQRVTAIRVVGESGAVLVDNPAGLALAPGQPFSIDAERETLRQLYRTGRYSDLVAEVSPAGGGLLLSFVAQQNYYVSRVVILGLREPPSDTQAASALGFSLGTTFHESDMPADLARLRSMLEDEGLHEAKISYQLSPHPDTRQMDITVRVVAGPRARAGAVNLVNQTPFPDAELRKRLQLKPKTEVTSDSKPIQVWDPVNPANNVARTYTESDRQRLVKTATTALEATAWAAVARTKGEANDAWRTVLGPGFEGA